MVRGLECFKNYFSDYADQYVLIGGTACTLVMESAGLDFRATKDLDIVLCVEALNAEFALAFWRFVKDGEYQNRQQSSGKDLFYRFHSPNNHNFPVMLEFFSRIPDGVKLGGEQHLTPIPIEESVTSLSAILLDDDYYQLIHSGKYEVNGLPVVKASHLIPLKAKAWLDLSEKKSVGVSIDEKDIRKHKNDIIRLYQLLHASDRIAMSTSIQQDMRAFIDCLEKDKPYNLKNLGIKHTSIEKLLLDFRQIYCID